MHKSITFICIFSLTMSSSVQSRVCEYIALRDILRCDGTIKAPAGFSGPVDFSGFLVTLNPCTGPVFIPTPVAPGWNALGTGLDNLVMAIAINGSDVYAGGHFTDAGGIANADKIARWDGGNWNALGAGLNDAVSAIYINGTDVYIGGFFTDAGGIADADYISRWDGSSWNALGTALNNRVYAIAVSGSDVYLGGFFTDAGGVAEADYIVRWNGSNYNALGSGLNNFVRSIAASGSNVYVGGDYTDAGGVADADKIARWDGSAWNALGAGLNNNVRSIAISGSNVYVGGFFTDAGGIAEADKVARWDGSAWNALATGLNHNVFTLSVSGSNLYAGGVFTDAGGIAEADFIARWDGNNWNALGPGLNATVWVLATNGSDTYAGGGFTGAGGNSSANYIARWDNTALPVELVNIAANRTANNINLTWRTASETQNAHFLVQHSTDGRIFHALAQIPGQGNSYQENSYEYLHENPSPGTNYYRLKQVDFDGQFEYSKTVSVKMESDDFDIHPNPTSGILQITGKEDFTGGGYFVKDSMGRLLQSGRLESLDIDISGLNTGIYLLEIRLEERVLVKRVVRQ